MRFYEILFKWLLLLKDDADIIRLCYPLENDYQQQLKSCPQSVMLLEDSVFKMTKNSLTMDIKMEIECSKCIFCRGYFGLEQKTWERGRVLCGACFDTREAPCVIRFGCRHTFLTPMTNTPTSTSATVQDSHIYIFFSKMADSPTYKYQTQFFYTHNLNLTHLRMKPISAEGFGKVEQS